MSWRRFRRLILFSLFVALALEAIRSLRGPEAPAFTRHPSAWDGQTPRLTAPARPAPPVIIRPEPPAAPPPVSEQTWTEPAHGGCPPGFPVKAKERSGIYHEPGMLAYDRTHPDRRCANAADAQSDGFRAAKR